jgi:hypothetical protein
MLVARALPNGNWRILDVTFNDHEGIKDGFCLVANELALEAMIATFDHCEFADVSLEHCREQARFAERVTLNAHRRLPLAYVVWRGMLEGDDPRDVEEFPMPTLSPGPEPWYLATCDELISLDEFGFWFFNPDEVDAFVDGFVELLDRLDPEMELPESDNYNALLRRAIETVVDDDYRHLLPSRLRRQAWLLAQLYEDEEIPLWALAAASGIEGGIIVDHPLLREMMELSLINAAS